MLLMLLDGERLVVASGSNSQIIAGIELRVSLPRLASSHRGLPLDGKCSVFFLCGQIINALTCALWQGVDRSQRCGTAFGTSNQSSPTTSSLLSFRPISQHPILEKKNVSCFQSSSQYSTIVDTIVFTQLKCKLE